MTVSVVGNMLKEAEAAKEDEKNGKKAQVTRIMS